MIESLMELSFFDRCVKSIYVDVTRYRDQWIMLTPVNSWIIEITRLIYLNRM